MDHQSRVMAPAAGKENAVVNSNKPWAAAHTTAVSKKTTMAPQPQQRQQTLVSKSPTARAGSTTASFTNKRIAVGRSGRGPGLALRADGNGGAPASALRGTTTAAAPGSRSKHQEEEAANTSSSSLDLSSTSSDFTGPQRVRVSNNNVGSDISLSFWSLPASSAPEGKNSSGRSDSRTASGAVARSARVPAATKIPVDRTLPKRTGTREPSAVGGGAIAGNSSSSGSSQVTASTRKRGRVEAAPPAATATAAATSAEARQQALKWMSGVSSSSVTRGGGASDERVAKDRRLEVAPAPASTSSSNSTPAIDSARLKSSFSTDFSHILNWKPERRPDSNGLAGASTTTTAAAAAAAAAAATRTTPAVSVKGREEGSTVTHARGRQQQEQQQQRDSDSAAAGNKQESAAAGASSGGSSSAVFASAAVAGGADVARGTQGNGIAPVSSSKTAARSKITSSSLEALRVRVVKKGDDKDAGGGGGEKNGCNDDDDSDDSFEVDLKLEAYDEEIRRRSSADATSGPPRPGATGLRSSSVPATAAPPVLLPHPPTPITTGRAVPALASGPAAAPLAPKALPAGGSGTVAGGPSQEGVGDSGADGGLSVLAGGSFGETAMSEPARSSGVGGGSRDGLIGPGAAAAAAASVMSRVPEEAEEDMSLTIGTGSRAPYPTKSDWSVSGGLRNGGGGGGAPISANGGRTEPSLSLGFEQTDSSDQASSGVAAGHERGGASSSGLLGGGSTGGSSLGLAPVGGKSEKEVAFAQGARGHGWSEVMVNGVRYLKTAQIGKGGSSKVFRVVAPDCEMMALKVVKVDNQVENAGALMDSYSNEIELLKTLQGNRFIITLGNSEVDRHRGLISIVLELGETDLDRLMRQYKANVASQRVNPATLGLFPGGLDANFVRVIWQQMLKAVEAMHEQRVVHGDLKPANFVFVKGSLKLIDFGIAKAISNDTVNISRDSRLGTMNYMCPEAFEDTGKGEVDPATGRQTPVIKQGRASDVWSLGCILYQMSHGHTPFSHLLMGPKIRAITNPGHAIAIADLKDEHLADTLRACLKRDPQERATIGGEGGLLSHPYLHPIEARASLETALNAKLTAANDVAEARVHAAEARADARIAELESEVDVRVKERVAALERDIYSRHEGIVAKAVVAAVAAEQARQAAGLSIAKSALKHIIATTVRVLNADDKSVNLDRADIDRITGLVIEMGRGGGAHAASTRQ